MAPPSPIETEVEKKDAKIEKEKPKIKRRPNILRARKRTKIIKVENPES
jgi:hypothetical protein